MQCNNSLRLEQYFFCSSTRNLAIKSPFLNNTCVTCLQCRRKVWKSGGAITYSLRSTPTQAFFQNLTSASPLDPPCSAGPWFNPPLWIMNERRSTGDNNTTIQVDNFQKVYFFLSLKEFEWKFCMTVLLFRINCQIFRKNVEQKGLSENYQPLQSTIAAIGNVLRLYNS